MQTPLLQLGCTLAVFLGLYAFYCHWEARRAAFADAFRRVESSPTAGGQAEATTYRSRSRWALLACGALIGSALLSAI
jgi:hypothetical protein